MPSTELLPGYLIQMHVNSNPVWWCPTYKTGWLTYPGQEQLPDNWTSKVNEAVVFADASSAKIVLSRLLNGIGAVVSRQEAAAGEVARASK